MDYRQLIPLVYQIVCTFPAIAGIICYRQLDRPAKILAYYYIIAALTDLIGFYIMRHGHSNMILYHFFDPVEYACLVFAFSYWTGNAKITRMLRYSIFGFIALTLINSLT